MSTNSQSESVNHQCSCSLFSDVRKKAATLDLDRTEYAKVSKSTNAWFWHFKFPKPFLLWIQTKLFLPKSRIGTFRNSVILSLGRKFWPRFLFSGIWSARITHWYFWKLWHTRFLKMTPSDFTPGDSYARMTHWYFWKFWHTRFYLNPKYKSTCCPFPFLSNITRVTVELEIVKKNFIFH